MEKAIPAHVHEQSFADIGQFARATGWDLDFRQLDAGILDATVSVIASPGIQVVKFGLNLGFHQVGNPPVDMLSFGVLAHEASEVSWCSESMPVGAMANFNMEDGFECVSGPGFTAYGLSLERSGLEQMAEHMGIPSPVNSLVQHRAIWNSPRTQKLASDLSSMYEQLCLNGSKVLEDYSRFINEEIAECILQELAGEEFPFLQEPPAHQERVMSRALQILADPGRLPISVADLCEESCTTSSTLYRLFQSRFGVSPKTYIRARCLSGVRDELAGTSDEVSIAEIANRWGFWHMGQFARDFRAQFGHLPSESVRQSSQRTAGPSHLQRNRGSAEPAGGGNPLPGGTRKQPGP